MSPFSAVFSTGAPAGIAIGLDLWLLFTALKTTTIANATVLGNLQPLVVMAFGMRRFGERVTAWLVGSAIAAVSGVVCSSDLDERLLLAQSSRWRIL